MYQNHLGEISEVSDPRHANWNHKSTGLPPSRKWILQNSSSSTSAWPLSSLQPSSGLPGTPGPATSTLLPHSPPYPQTPSSPVLSKGPSLQQEIHQAIPVGGACPLSRPHLLSQRLHFSNFPTLSPQVHKEGRTRDSTPLRRPLRYPALQTHPPPAPPPPPPRRCEGGAQEAGRREAHLRGRELAAPPGRCRACHQGAASCNRSLFSTLHSPRG